MKYRFFLLCLLLFTGIASGSIPTQKVIAVTDSILVSKVGEHLRCYFEISKEGSHYNYLSSNKKSIAELFVDKKKIKKNFHEIWVLYQFNYTKIEGMKSGIWIKLDGNLQLLEEPNLKSVPDFLIHDLPSTFITKKLAKEIAEKSFFNTIDVISDAKLEYLKKKDKYIYTIANKTLKIIEGKRVVALEVIELDAYTGKLVNRYDSYNGLIEK